MDYFFWEFNQKCNENGIGVDWFFPNYSNHGSYPELTIYSDESKSIENNFLHFVKNNNSDYTHVITHFVELCTPFFAEVKKFSHAKMIAVDHNPRPLNGYSFKKKINKRLKGILFSKYIDLFVGVSNYTINAILKDFGTHLKSKTITIYNGVIIDAILVQEKRNIAKPTFLVASHIRESKGIQDLIAAVNLLPSQIKSEIQIDIYGEGPYQRYLTEMIQRFQLESCFTFMGSSSELKSTYYKYDYLIHPSYEETFCYTVVEALAANIKVITTYEGGNVLGIIEHLENGFLFEAKKINQLSDLIKQVWDANLKIDKETRPFIENSFSLKKMVEKYLELVRE
ncbi:glycosyltransferase family 4 protein [Flavobacterium sp. SE-1-e]|uniref:Glycosyltransferase family 4 protein n=2 Tax=Flavobacterium agrisoli TaxID=2793066 RepID=A0A934PP13_9FLAO|nr:glycosyltransferase family 4 protein [Flavobacterium agrisoli]